MFCSLVNEFVDSGGGVVGEEVLVVVAGSAESLRLISSLHLMPESGLDQSLFLLL
jgi:hypothetical protein